MREVFEVAPVTRSVPVFEQVVADPDTDAGAVTSSFQLKSPGAAYVCETLEPVP
jgi:hypothetical protein